MIEVIMFIVIALSIHGYNGHMDKVDKNRGVHKPLQWEKYEMRELRPDTESSSTDLYLYRRR